jgi:hypothetical protein
LRATVAVVLTVLVVGTAAGQDHTRFLRWAGQDGSALVQRIGPGIPSYVILGAGIVLPSSQADAPLLERVQRGYDGRLRQYLDATNEIGGPRAMLPVAGVFGVSLLTNSERFQDAAFTSFESLLYAGTLTIAAKYLFGRHRPDDTSSTNVFSPFSGNSSFPSGHSTAAFAIITPWVLYYRDSTPLVYGLFALSTGTAVARVARNRHWPTDVLVGSAIGFMTARYLTNRHKNAPGAREVKLSAVLLYGEPGLRLSIPLG